MKFLRKDFLKAGESVSGLYSKLANLPEPKVTRSICCWTDLLGFGASFYSSNWEPSQGNWDLLSDRITNATVQCYSNLCPIQEFVLTLNDGIVRCCDLDRVEHLDHLSLWLRCCIWTHNSINEGERGESLPGARTIVTAGPSMKYSPKSIRLDDFVYNYTKKDPKKLSSIARYSGNPEVAINPGPLQMNLAFSKGFLLDSWGSKVGLRGAHFFVDDSVLCSVRDLHARLNSPVKIIDEVDDSMRLFAAPKNESRTRHHLGFEFDVLPIKVQNEYIDTQLWRLLYFYPFDEDVADFKSQVI